MSTTPAMPPSGRLASLDLYTLIVFTAVAGRFWNAKARPTPLFISRPLSVVTTFGNPRITTEVVSPWKPCATCTPVMRCIASATLLSGSLPMSSATIESTTTRASCFSDCALCRLLRSGVTVTPERLVAVCSAALRFFSRCAAVVAGAVDVAAVESWVVSCADGGVLVAVVGDEVAAYAGDSAAAIIVASRVT